jgi:Ca2+-binding RTX toxin-like protein
MLNTTQLKEYAQLTQATYAYFTASDYQNSGGLKAQLIKESGSATKGANFTDKEAALFTERYELLDQYQSDSLDFSGFSGALFRDKDTGRLILSCRGTEPMGLQLAYDLLSADARIGLDGYASPQAIPLYRYIKQLMTPPGEAVQYTTQEISRLQAIFLDQADSPQELAARSLAWPAAMLNFLSDRGAGFGVAPLIPAGCPNLDFVGHSLGGHLAMLASRFFPGLAAQVVTLNAPNFFPQSESVLELFSPGWANASIIRMEGVGDGISEIGTTYPGSRILLGQENESGLLAAFGVNHDKVNSADGLALVELIGKLDSRFADDARLAKAYIDQASEVPGQSYEKLLDGLRRIFLGKDVAPTAFNDGTKPSSRDSFYTNISILAGNNAFKALIGKVEILPAADGMAARTDFASFLTLRTLSPITLKATAGSEAAVEAALAVNWGSEYSDWKTDQDLTPQQLAEGQGTYTDLYLADRAAMLTWKLKLAASDIDAAATPYRDAPDAWFRDNASNLTVHLGAMLTNSTDKPRYIFGADQLVENNVENLQGGTNNDHIYGGGGTDQLNGEGGNDYLEGNAGNDIVNGGLGNDYLEGGSGDDKLTGGEGRDTLLGGVGFDTLTGGADKDTYRFAPNSGTDHIIDDGNDSIEWKSLPIAGVYRWQEDRKAYLRQGDGSAITLSLDGQSTLTFEDGSKVILDQQNGIDGFKNDPYGIRLEKLPTQPTTTLEVLGDIVPTDFSITIRRPIPGMPGIGPGWSAEQSSGLNARELAQAGAGTAAYDMAGLVGSILPANTSNYWSTFDELTTTYYYRLFDALGNAVGERKELPAGSDYSDELWGSNGNDHLLALRGDDWVPAGKGNDIVVGGTQEAFPGYQDYLMGEEGNDLIYADEETSLTELPSLSNFGGAVADNRIGDDLFGGIGDDILVGSARRDVILGGAGKDLILGGAGDDMLNGDQDRKPGDVMFDFNWGSGFSTG